MASRSSHRVVDVLCPACSKCGSGPSLFPSSHLGERTSRHVEPAWLSPFTRDRHVFVRRANPPMADTSHPPRRAAGPGETLDASAVICRMGI